MILGYTSFTTYIAKALIDFLGGYISSVVTDRYLIAGYAKPATNSKIVRNMTEWYFNIMLKCADIR